MSPSSHLIRVVIPTTEGPAAVDRLIGEPDELGCSVALVSQTEDIAGISDRYEAYASREQGPIRRIAGAGFWRLELSRDVQSGDSWQAAVTLAHALAGAGRLAAPDHTARATVWITGLVGDDGAMAAVEHVPQKLERSMQDLLAETGQGRRVIVALPAGNLADLDATTLERLRADGIEVAAVDTLDDLLRSLGLRSTLSSGRTGARTARIAGGIVVSAVIASVVALALRQSSPTIFRDCADCPQMVVLPDRYAPGGAAGRSTRLAFARYAVTIAEYEAFIADTGRDVVASCNLPTLDGSYAWRWQARSFREPSYPVTPSHPVTCVSFADAVDYASWLSRKTGRRYRLPTSSEREFATRAGTTTAYSFGGDDRDVCDHARFAHAGTPLGRARGVTVSCPRDSHHGPLPVGSLKPNPWGLYDMHGNVWEWVSDCVATMPSERDASATAGASASECKRRIIRGGGYNSRPQNLQSAAVEFDSGDHRGRSDAKGFRVVLDLDPPGDGERAEMPTAPVIMRSAKPSVALAPLGERRAEARSAAAALP